MFSTFQTKPSNADNQMMQMMKQTKQFGTNVLNQNTTFQLHHANMIMDWLNIIIKERMLAVKHRWGHTWAPSAPDLNPLDFFQDQKGDEGAARDPGQKGSFYHREEGSQSNVCKWKAFCVENSD